MAEAERCQASHVLPSSSRCPVFLCDLQPTLLTLRVKSFLAMPTTKTEVKVPYFDLTAQYRDLRDEIREAIDRVCNKAAFILGEEVERFEKAFAEYCGVRHAIGLNSGTSALHLALLAAGIGPGDEVITVPFTFVATTAAIIYARARPVFVDIDPRCFTMNVAHIERAISSRTKAIVPVHLY